MRILEQGVDPDQMILQALSAGSPMDEPAVEKTVREIIESVRRDGDTALLELGRRFDSPSLAAVAVDAAELARAWERLDAHLREALQRSADNVRRFHEEEKQSSWFSPRGGGMLGQIVRPLRSVGIYVPGGRAAYPSSVLMTAIPASVAGVEDICVATPVSHNGEIPDAVLGACHLCGVRRVFRMGGAQAIAAFAYGTQTVPRVDKVVGPGNQYVNVAKRVLYGQVGVDSLAGPSEVLIIADESTPASWVAADLIAQAEHGGESKAVLITWSRPLADRVLAEISAQTAAQPRAQYIRAALDSRGLMLVVPDAGSAARWADACAPEHLELLVRSPQEWISRIHNAGAIFAGAYSPVPLGDYAAGPSHTLPTGTAARFSSALGVAEFQKRTSLIWYSRDQYERDALAGMTIAECEGLAAHRASLAKRLEGADE